jgi:hypothetical protein
MGAWLNPWSLFGTTFVAGLFAQMAFPRQRWSAALAIAVAPLAFLTVTIWWRVWERDALYAVAYFFGLLICGGASISSVFTVDAGRRSLRK